MYIKTTDKEKNIIKFISKVTSISEDKVRSIFLYNLIYNVIYCFDNKEEFEMCLPFLSSLFVKMSHSDTIHGKEIDFEVDTELSDYFKKEIKAILNNEMPESSQMFRSGIKDILNGIVNDGE